MRISDWSSDVCSSDLLLGADLSAPLMDRHAIERRLALVQWFHDDSNLRGNMRGALKALPDIGRALGRIAVGRGSPRDLVQLRDVLNEARLLRELMGRLPDIPDRKSTRRHFSHECASRMPSSA